MLTAVLSTWVLIITVVMPGRTPLVHEASTFATQAACETFKAQLLTASQEAVRRAQEQREARLSTYPRTYVCTERMSR